MFFFEFSENVFLKNTSGRVFLKCSILQYVWISGIFYAVVLNIYLKKLLCLECEMWARTIGQSGSFPTIAYHSSTITIRQRWVLQLLRSLHSKLLCLICIPYVNRLRWKDTNRTTTWFIILCIFLMYFMKVSYFDRISLEISVK